MDFDSVIDLHAAMLSNSKDTHAKKEQYKNVRDHEIGATIMESPDKPTNTKKE